DAEPVGILRRVLAPHGLRFTSDGQHLVVADADAPEIHVYACEQNDWRGVRNPSVTVTIMDDDKFRTGHIGPGQGGPKGLDIDAGSQIVAVTSQFQPLAFFHLATLLEHSTANDGRDLMADDVRFELKVMEDHLRLAHADSLLGQLAESNATLTYI